MKRPPKPFVVERKRSSRSRTDKAASIWTGSAGRELRRNWADEATRSANNDDGMIDRGAGSEQSDVQPEEEARRGRILETIEAKPASIAPIATVGQPNVADLPTSSVSPVRRCSMQTSEEALPLEGTAKPPALMDMGAFPTQLATSGYADVELVQSHQHLSYRQRRRAATGNVPAGERWKQRSGLQLSLKWPFERWPW